MSSSFTLSDRGVKELCDEVIKKYHADLDSAAVNVDLVMCFRDPEGEAPAILKDGQRVLGSSKSISLKDRVKGMGDCEIILDGDAWGSMPLPMKEALLDHHLQCFEVKRDKNGDFIFDDINRPVVKMRPHDRVIRFFDTVAQRHGTNSIEAEQLRSMFLGYSSTYLPFVPAKEKSNEPLSNEEEIKCTLRVGDEEADFNDKEVSSKLLTKAIKGQL